MSGVSTHVLDTARGRPAAGVAVSLEALADGTWQGLARGTTDADGRIAALLPGGPPAAGDYRLRFATGDYLRGQGGAAFYPEVVVHVRLEPGMKYHLPLLLSPFGYSTYRGS
ncbi:MAG TPA: hydroxyisourate hydrolase [Gemmataceae bacterium]|jgi:5-hydroxyisourate hydrolase